MNQFGALEMARWGKNTWLLSLMAWVQTAELINITKMWWFESVMTAPTETGETSRILPD